MKKLLAPLLAFGLVGCVTIPQSMITTAEKSLTIAHLAYNAIGTSLIEAANAGVLVGANAATAKLYYDKAGDALMAADTADAAANAQGILTAIVDAESAIAQADAIVHPKK